MGRKKPTLDDYLHDAYEKDERFQEVMKQLKRKTQRTIAAIVIGGFFFFSYLVYDYYNTLQYEQMRYEWRLSSLNSQIEEEVKRRVEKKLYNVSYQKKIAEQIKREIKKEYQSKLQNASARIQRLEKQLQEYQQLSCNEQKTFSHSGTYWTQKVIEKHVHQLLPSTKEVTEYDVQQPKHPEWYYFQKVPERYKHTGGIITINSHKWTLDQLSEYYTGEKYLWKYFINYDRPEADNEKIRNRNYEVRKGDKLYIPYPFLKEEFQKMIRQLLVSQ